MNIKNVKNDFKLAFKPEMLSSVTKANFSNGLGSMVSFFILWLIIHVIIALINGVVDKQALGGVFLFSLLTGLSVAIIGIIGLLVIGLVSSWCSKLFKGSNDVQKTIGLVAAGVLPLVIIGFVRDLILLISTLGNHFLANSFYWVNLILFAITLVWLAWLLTEAIVLANKVKKGQALLCFIVGFIAAALVAWPVRWLLVKVVTQILTGVL